MMGGSAFLSPSKVGLGVNTLKVWYSEISQYPLPAPTNNELGCVGLPTMDGNLGNQDSSPALGTGNIPPGTQSLCLSNEGIDQIRNCILVA